MGNSHEHIAEIDKTILPWLGRTMKALDLHMADVFAQHGLPLNKPQIILLRRLTDNNGIPQNNLAFITNRDKTSLTRLIQNMEKKGLVNRKHSDEDRRVNHVFITQKGRDLFEKAFPIVKEVMELIQADISSDELETTINVLKKISIKINADELTAPLTNSK